MRPIRESKKNTHPLSGCVSLTARMLYVIFLCIASSVSFRLQNYKFYLRLAKKNDGASPFYLKTERRQVFSAKCCGFDASAPEEVGDEDGGYGACDVGE